MLVAVSSQMQIDFGGLQILVPEIRLQDFQVHARLKHGRGVGVSQGVRTQARLLERERLDDLCEAALHGSFTDGLRGSCELLEIGSCREQPLGIAMRLPVFAERVERGLWQWDAAVIAVLGRADLQEHTVRINIVNRQMPGITGSQSAGVLCAKEGLQVRCPRGVDQLPDFVGDEYGGERSRLGNANGLKRFPFARYGDAEEELDAPHDGPHGVWLELFASQEQILSDLFFGQLIGCDAIMLSQLRDRRQIGLDGLRLLAVEAQILAEALSQY